LASVAQCPSRIDWNSFIKVKYGYREPFPASKRRHARRQFLWLPQVVMAVDCLVVPTGGAHFFHALRSYDPFVYDMMAGL
jgi:hypothetical protein